MTPQQRRRLHGLCARCTKEALAGATLCWRHLIGHREYMRRWAGWGAWRPGGPGFRGRQEVVGVQDVNRR